MGRGRLETEVLGEAPEAAGRTPGRRRARRGEEGADGDPLANAALRAAERAGAWAPRTRRLRKPSDPLQS